MKLPIPYGHQWITNEDIQSVVNTLHSDYLTQGPRLKEFEDSFAQYVGAKYAVAVCNATAALHISVKAMGVNSHSNVIVSPLTFASSANCVKFCGGNVKFCDINPETYLIDIDKIHQELESKPEGTYQGIIPVDFAGYPVDMEKLRELANQYNLWIIEDACHAPGAYFIDSKSGKQYCGNGKYADCSVFSFHPVKHIATGEGGMVTTNNKTLYEKLCSLRSHGITKDITKMEKSDGGWYYEMTELGYNYRLTDMQAALGTSQLKRAKDGLNKRHYIAEKYTKAFSEVEGIKTPKIDDNFYHGLHLYIIQVEDRLGLYNFLRENQIYAQVHYYPLHLMPYYKQFGNKEGDLPIVEDYYKHCLSLPIFPTLTEEQQDYVIKKVIEFITK